MLLRTTATYFLRVMTAGRTFPILCGCADVSGNSIGEFVVKLLGQPAKGSRGVLYEFVASRLAEHFGILVPEPAAVGITREFSRLLADSQPHLAAALQTSVGLNFGSRIMNGMSTWFPGRMIPDAMLGDATKIFAFDAFIQNPDRLVERPNLFTRSDDLFVFDHESSFSFLFTVGGRSSPWNLEREAYLRNHVFYSKLRSKRLDLSEFKCRLEALTETELDKIRSEVPVEWMHGDFERIGEHLGQVRAHVEEFVEQVKRSLV
jgi:hypothetical protein